MQATTIESLEAELREYSTSQASRSAQKIFAGISLVILAQGFSLIGLLSLTHGPLAGDSLAFSAISCVIGGWAGVGAGRIFFTAASAFWPHYSHDPVHAATHQKKYKINCATTKSQY